MKNKQWDTFQARVSCGQLRSKLKSLLYLVAHSFTKTFIVWQPPGRMSGRQAIGLFIGLNDINDPNPLKNSKVMNIISVVPVVTIFSCRFPLLISFPYFCCCCLLLVQWCGFGFSFNCNIIYWKSRFLIAL